MRRLIRKSCIDNMVKGRISDLRKPSRVYKLFIFGDSKRSRSRFFLLRLRYRLQLFLQILFFMFADDPPDRIEQTAKHADEQSYHQQKPKAEAAVVHLKFADQTPYLFVTHVRITLFVLMKRDVVIAVSASVKQFAILLDCPADYHLRVFKQLFDCDIV